MAGKACTVKKLDVCGFKVFYERQNYLHEISHGERAAFLYNKMCCTGKAQFILLNMSIGRGLFEELFGMKWDFSHSSESYSASVA